MNWKEQLDKAIETLKQAAESGTMKNLTAKAKETASTLAQKAKTGALGAAEAFVEANSDPSTFKVRYLSADVSVVSPSDGIEITRPSANSVVISDGAGNGIVINAAAAKAYVSERIGTVAQLGGNTYDLGAEDGVNVVVLKD
ncbi:MAG: hypothetical protein ACREXK_06185 [Gammaproteobacteria bacterium]